MDNHWSKSPNTSTDYGSGPFFLESPNRDRNPEVLLAFVEQFCGENEMLVQGSPSSLILDSILTWIVANSSILTIPRGNSCVIQDSALLPRSLGSRSVSSTTLASETVVPGIDDEAAVQPTQLNSLENVHFDSQMNHQTVPIAMFNSLLTSQKSVLRELTVRSMFLWPIVCPMFLLILSILISILISACARMLRRKRVPRHPTLCTWNLEYENCHLSQPLQILTNVN